MNKSALRSVNPFVSGLVLVALLLLARSFFTHSLYYYFLLWNLLLAFIPYSISRHLLQFSAGGQSGQFVSRHFYNARWWAGFVLWLLFFPNAPYIITDFTHLSARQGVPLWYDAALLFCAASTGLWLGCLSLMQMETAWRRKVPRIGSGVFVVATLLLCSFGIYLGRVLRFNSWDVLLNPLDLLAVIARRLLMPWQYLRTWGVTLLFAAILGVGYRQVKGLVNYHSG